jgi:hypothetical protein
MKKNKKCVICEKELKLDPHFIILDAVVCSTQGNYGSSVFDPMNLDGFIQKHLVFYICDDCLVSKSKLFQYEEVVNEKKITLSKSFAEFSKENKEKK